MHKIEDIYPLIKDAFLNNLTIDIPVRGTSMLPMLRTNDYATLKKIDRPLKKGDIVFYQRDNSQFVLHRIRRVLKDNTYVIVGDHQRRVEYGITNDHLIGYVISYKKKNKTYSLNRFSYKIYKLIVRCSLIRAIFGRLYHEKKI